jgi:hypothetical protein
MKHYYFTPVLVLLIYVVIDGEDVSKTYFVCTNLKLKCAGPIM